MVDVEEVMSLVSFVLLLWSENNETFGQFTEKRMSAEARAENPQAVFEEIRGLRWPSSEKRGLMRYYCECGR